MTKTQQPEALRLADALEKSSLNPLLSPLMELATELRRQHARIAELEDVADMAIKRIAELEAQLCGGGAKAVPLYTSALLNTKEV